MATPGDNKEKITYFAETDYRSRRLKFGIRDDDRERHMYVIGKTGMGKSTLLENLAIQDIQNGEGLCFIDPHGGTAETLLSYVPEHRIKDVVYFAPFDMEHPVAINVMEDIGRDKRALVASGLIGAFKKVWVDAWSPRMEYLLNNALLALLEYPGSTLLGVNRIFSDKNYRAMIVNNVQDPSVRLFWTDEYAKYSDKFATEATAAIQNKVGQFSANPLIRNMIGQPKSTFDIRTVMDEKKILIVNLSKGRMGEGNANLVGSMLITKIYLAAMSRAEVGADAVKRLPPFYLYVDEFQSFANESFADILSEARKYKLTLTIAHQYIEQMSDEVRAAVFGNVGTMVTFRVGSYDAEVLEKEFAPTFTAEDLVNLGFAQIYLKLMINGVGSPPFSATTLPRPKVPPRHFTDEVIAASRAQFARPRAVVEEEIRKWHEPIPEQPRDSNRDPSASQVPETRKYAPGTRPARGPSDGYAPGAPGGYERRAAPRNAPPASAPMRAPQQFAPQQIPQETAVPTHVPADVPDVRPAPELTMQAAVRSTAPLAMRIPSPPGRVPLAPSRADIPTPPPPSPAATHRPFAEGLARLAHDGAWNASPMRIAPIPSVTAKVEHSAPTVPSSQGEKRRHEERSDPRVHAERVIVAPSYAGADRRHASPHTGDSLMVHRGERAPQATASLSALKIDPKKNKGPSSENISSLRAALEGVLAGGKGGAPANASQTSQTPSSLKVSPVAPKAPISLLGDVESEMTTQEVPEDVSKTILAD